MNLFPWFKKKKKLTWEEEINEELKNVNASSIQKQTNDWVKHQEEARLRKERLEQEYEEKQKIEFPDTAERNLIFDIQYATRELKYKITVIIGNQYDSAEEVAQRIRNRGFEVTKIEPCDNPRCPMYLISWENK